MLTCLMGLAENFLGAKRQNVAYQAIIGFEELRVGQGDPLFAVWLDGKNANLEHVSARILKQGGIFQPPDDVFIDVPRLVCRKQLRFNLPAIDFHGELVDVRTFWYRKHKRAFQTRGIWIVEFLVHGGDCNLVGDAGINPDRINLERRK